MKHPHVQWCATLWDSLNDGGTWAVPRSGLVFIKHTEGKRLQLHERLEGFCDAVQSADLVAIRDHFARIGVKVE